jgi:[ribosomal protein S5]-alanine N-acetyltransferase
VIQPFDPPDAIGIISAWFGSMDVELGFVLARSYWGRGLMTEAVTAVKDWALAHSSVDRVWATCDVENFASARVLEKSGLTPRGIFHRRIVRPNIGPEPRASLLYESAKGAGQREART